MNPTSPEARKRINARYYASNKNECRKRNSDRVARNRKFVNDFKEGKPCCDCGICYIPCVMELDHCRGEKTNHIARMVCEGNSIERIYQEILKCDLVCANCHRIRTHNRRLSHSGRAPAS